MGGSRNSLEKASGSGLKMVNWKPAGWQGRVVQVGFFTCAGSIIFGFLYYFWLAYLLPVGLSSFSERALSLLFPGSLGVAAAAAVPIVWRQPWQMGNRCLLGGLCGLLALVALVRFAMMVYRLYGDLLIGFLAFA